MRSTLTLLSFCALALSGAHAESGADAPRARLITAFGGGAIDEVGRFDYRLSVEDERGRLTRLAQYSLSPGAPALYVRDLQSAERPHVWWERDGAWRIVGGQLEFLSASAATPYAEHVGYHFLSLFRDEAARFEALAPDRVRITPAGLDAFEVVIDPVTKLIRENRFEGGMVGRELDYRTFAGVQWPLRFEIVRAGRVMRRGRFSDVQVRKDTALPALEVPVAARRLPAPYGDAARLVGAGWMSTPRNEYNVTQDAGGRLLVFARSQAHFERARIMVSRREDGGWSEPQPVSFTDTRYSDSDPWLTPDGAWLYFISNRPKDGETPRKDLDIWRSAIEDGRFGAPERLDALASDAMELGPEVHDGWLYFNSSRPGGPAHLSIYRARMQGARLGTPEPLGSPFNDGAAQGDFTLSPDGRIAVFWSEREGAADADLFAVRREGQIWGRAVRLPGPINARGFDFTPAFSADGEELRFASMRKPSWITDGEHLLNGEANVYVAPAALLQAALSLEPLSSPPPAR